MYWMQLRDGSREPFAAEDDAEAMREAVRRCAPALELAGAAVSRAEMLQALDLGRPGVFAEYGPEWQAPTGAEVRALLKLARLTGSAAGRLVGVNSAKVRRWAGEGGMPYAVWRLLTVYARQAAPAVMPVDRG